jgi:hypothetical protein
MLRAKGVELSEPITEQGWGSLTKLKLSDGESLALNQPKHPMAIKMSSTPRARKGKNNPRPEREETKAWTVLTCQGMEQAWASAFMVQEPALALKPAAISRQRTVGSNHPMTRHNNPNRVGSIGQANGPDRGWPADSLR